jgi:tellurite resistance protein TerC/cation:H+ antiporter
VIIKTLHQARRFFKILVGFTLLLIGVVMIVTPGPGVLTIVLALGVLAAEFVWARRLLDGLKEQGVRIRQTVFRTTDNRAA